MWDAQSGPSVAETYYVVPLVNVRTFHIATLDGWKQQAVFLFPGKGPLF